MRRRGRGRLVGPVKHRGAAASLRRLAAVVLLAACSGANCPKLPDQFWKAPPGLPASASLAQVIEAVNGNTQRVRTLSAQDVVIQAPLVPALKANLALERPRRFRLIAETTLTGPEIDLGSNDELFWIWVRRSEPRGLLFCRHDQYLNSSARQSLPLDPQWFIEALGLVWFDPSLVHYGPYLNRGQMEIHTFVPTPYGHMIRVTVLDARRGTVLQHNLYNEQRRLVASAQLSRHRYDEKNQVVLPEQIEVVSPMAGLTLTVTVRDWQINTEEPAPASAARWQLPDYPGWPRIDLARLGPAHSAPPRPSAPPQPAPLFRGEEPRPEAEKIELFPPQNRVIQPTEESQPAATEAETPRRSLLDLFRFTR